ncbi:protein PLASTID MOVEMENT IMPAIRED 1 [Phoenix dactylifera]|uniref:Protein PLASTID MOVEMENT IMPAIRED 1 n=1 Tax=Phoenix dactylifera TaxID=42345 RepID=A0A8B7CRE5_PHODC|nr:protein PLASTID MOVEMENT IMPAIRED 1 [Phoenix dactylifera]
MADQSERRNSNNQLLQELDALSHSLYQAHTARRTASLALPSSAKPTSDAELAQSERHLRSRRLSMSPWRSRPKPQHEPYDDGAEDDRLGRPSKNQKPAAGTGATAGEKKKGIWNWKPMRALSHIMMRRLGCLFSVEVVAVQGLPASMNGLRLSVAVRKKETKEGAVRTMPSRVLQGSADFEEMLFIRCHVYCSGGSGAGKPLKLEARPFLISVVAVDAPELDFGNSIVDLSLLVKESMEGSFEGARIRQRDTTFPLSGKAKGGELVLKLGFQIMEDGGFGIYNQAEVGKSSSKGKDSSSSFARRQSKSSFSVSSPRITRPEPSSSPTKEMPAIDLKGIDDFSLDEPGPPPSSSPSIHKSEPEPKDELDFPEFEVVEKGVEIQAEKEEEEAAVFEEAADGTSVSSEVVKEVVHDTAHPTRLPELDAIAQQIEALESMMMRDGRDPTKTAEEDERQRLDAEEETVTREFLQMLELEDEKDMLDRAALMKSVAEEGRNAETSVFLSDLGKGLGSIVQTRDGGYLAAMNPFDVELRRKETPKLAMQISKPFILGDQKLASGFEVFQRLAALGSEELGSKLHSLAAMDELMGKTAEQIAFEGIASAIISGRNKEGANSSAARSVAILKTMATAMNEGRKERISTGIWNVREKPVTMEEILAFSLQKIEAMAVEALKIQAGMAEEESPFDVASLVGKAHSESPLDSAIPPEDWAKTCSGATMITLLVILQLRDPVRRYEMVGAPSIAIIQAVRVDDAGDEEGRYKLASLHVGGLKLKSGGRRSIWDGEKQRLTAMQWLVAFGPGKARKKSKLAQAKGGQDVVWSMSSRVMADMWLKPIRNPDVKVSEQ